MIGSPQPLSASMRYGVKIVEKKMKLLLQGLGFRVWGLKGDLLFSGFSSAMKYGVKVWKLPKLRALSRGFWK